MQPLFKGEQIYDLIPQRPPIVMVDALYRADEEGALTGLDVLQDNLFIQEGCLAESGIIEHVAQSSAAMAGYDTYKRGLPPNLGYIAEIKKFRIFRLPAIGETLSTELRVLGTAGNMTLFSAETVTAKGPVASGQMKIFIKE